MTFADDERGQPVVIGALLIFTILILAFAGYQAFAVPQQNAEVEFNHFQDVQSDFAELESNLVNAVESGDTRSASIDLGPQYPSRMLALNPPPAAGTLRTTEAGDVEFEGESICGDDAETRSLLYRPGYAEFDNAESIVYENRVTGRQFREGNVFGEQRLVASDSDRINLLLLTGEVSENGVGVSNLEIEATSRYSETVDSPIITLPSQFSETEWENILGDDVEDVQEVAPNRIEFEFDGEYRVSCAVAGLNSEPAFSPPVQTTPEEPNQELSAPTIEAVELDDFEDLGTARVPGGFFTTTGPVQDVIQYNLSYTVTAEDDNLEYVALRLEDTNGEIITATTQVVPGDSRGEYSGRWHTPWFDVNYLEDNFAGDPENYQVSIEAYGTNSPSQSGTVSVGGNLDVPEQFDVTIEDTNSPVTEGEDLNVETTVVNSGSGEGTQTIELLNFDGTVVDSSEVTLASGESTTVDLTWSTANGDAGSGDITVESEDASDTEAVTIEDEVSSTPTPEPTFDSLTAEVTDYQDRQEKIEEISIDGSIQNTDTSGDIRFNLEGSNNGRISDNPRTISMEDSFSEEFSTGSGSNGQDYVEVTVSLLDGGGDEYIVCEGTRRLTSAGDELSLEDGEFTCN